MQITEQQWYDGISLEEGASHAKNHAANYLEAHICPISVRDPLLDDSSCPISRTGPARGKSIGVEGHQAQLTLSRIL